MAYKITMEQVVARAQLVGKHYYILTDNEEELRQIERDLEEKLGCFVKCGYDSCWSHKYQEEQREDADYIINYELYLTAEDKKTEGNGNGGVDGEVHELFYLKGNGDYIVITEV